jgi:hypothetical protein
LVSTTTSSASSSAAIRRGLPGDVSRSNAGQHRLGLTGGDVAFGLSWQQFGKQRLESVDGLDPAPGQGFASVGEHPQCLELRVDLQHPQGRGAERDHRHCVGVGLAVVAGVEQTNPGSQLRRDVDDLLAVFEETLREWPAGSVAASTAHTRSGQAPTYFRIAA